MIRVTAAPSLSTLTTLRLGGRALAEVALEDVRDFDALPDALASVGGVPMVMGGGSNILAADGELPLTLIRPLCGERREPETVGETDGKVLLRVGAGMRLPALLNWCSERGLSGLEGLVGVPGRVGGGVAMNAGAYGCEIGPLVRELTVFTPERSVHALKPDQWETGYRRFALKSNPAWFVAAEAVLALVPSSSTLVREAMRANLEQKKRTQPLDAHTAGCVFKNPPGLSAGKLLDEAGMRGKGKGGMRFTEKHANFLAHEQGGSFQAAMELMEEAKEIVARRTGIHLQLEIKVWTCPSS